MTHSRILPLLGPAVVLYLVADIASVRDGLSVVGLVVAAVAVLVSFTPYLTRGRIDVHGTRRVAMLGVFGGLGLVGAVEAGAGSLAAQASAQAGAVIAGVIVIDLAATVPRGWMSPARRRGLRALVGVVAVVVLGVGLLAIAPPVRLAGRLWLSPAAGVLAPSAFAASAVLVALGLRWLRRRRTDDPLALAANAWALMGLLPAVVAAGLAFGLLGRVHDAWVRGLGAGAVAVVVAGHVALVDPSRRLHADRTGRRVLGAAVTLGVLVVAAVLAHPVIPEGPAGFGVSVAVALVLAVPVYRAVAPAAQFVLAPDRGRLLGAIARIERELGAVASLDELARVVLAPLREASRQPEAMPLLYAVHPPLELRIDAAREPHVRERGLSETVQSRLLEHPGEVVVRGALEGHVVRRPELRPLVDALQQMDALCVAPLLDSGELEGALIVPRGRRGSLPSLEEIAALETLGERLASRMVLLSSQERARVRTAQAMRARDEAEERIETLEDEVQRVRAEAQALRFGRGASRVKSPPVAYGPAMRALEGRIDRVAPMDAPVLLVSEGGTPVDQVARWVHERSGRSGGPFVVADCASVRPEHSLAALLGKEGEAGEPGWLQLAEGGTLLLADVPALSREAQSALAEALAAKSATPVGGTGGYRVDVRAVATSRVDLDPLVRGEAFDAELGRWLGKLRLEVPPLRERKEDIPSLALLAVDRACRVLGREVMGMDQSALDVLLQHDWPGNLRELQHVVDRAVARAEEPQVGRDDLPPLAPRQAEDDPLAGTYAAIEKRILRRAMERAGGNKSQAARNLGLKRTTFLDKLRRQGLDEPDKAEQEAN